MKTLYLFLEVLFYSSVVLSQINQPKQLTNFDYDSRNPEFIWYPFNMPFYGEPGEIFFEAHTDSGSNIYAMDYSVEEDSFLEPYSIIEGNFQNKNISGGFFRDADYYKMILWETNQNGNWDIVYAKNYGSGFSDPQLFYATDNDETSPSIVMDHINYFYELNILYVSNNSVYVYTKTDSTETNFLLFQADDSTTYSNPAGAFYYYDGLFYAVAVEKINFNTSRIVYKKRLSNTNIWSELSVAYEGYYAQNPKFVDPSPADLYLNFEIVVNSRIRSVLMSPADFGAVNPPIIYVVEDSTIESSEFDSYSFYIITDQGNFSSPYPYSYKIKGVDSTFIISGSEDWYYYEYKINTKIIESGVAIGPLVYMNHGIVSYTVWEDSSNGRINLFGLKRFDIISDVKDETFTSSFSLSQNYPNPFNPTTNIVFRIAEGGFVTLKVYDILGNEIATLVNEEKTAGEYEVEFNTSSINHHPSSGIYFYQLKAGSFVETKKMILLK